jgi:hypothetical protein
MDALFAIPSAALALLDSGPTAGTTHAALRVTLACVLFLGLVVAIAHARWRECRETIHALHRMHGLELPGPAPARFGADAEYLRRSFRGSDWPLEDRERRSGTTDAPDPCFVGLDRA